MVNHVMLIMSIVVLAINFNNCYFMDIRYTPFINTPTGFRINQNLRLVPYVMVDTKSLYPPALVICCVYPTRCFFLKWCLFFSAMLSNSYFFIMYRKKKKKTMWVCHNGPWWVPQNPMAMVMFPFQIASGIKDRVKLKGPPVRHGEVDLWPNGSLNGGGKCE